MSKGRHPHSATNLRVGTKEPTVFCPVCGANKPPRALVTCRACWRSIPEYIKSEAMKAAKEDRESLKVGTMAAKVIASAVPKELLEEAA